MMKGPITLVIVITALLSLIVWERKAKWMRPLGFWVGPVVFLLIVVPWMYLIWDKTDGQFFKVAISEDLAPKLAGGAESHGAPIGYYAVTVWAMLWPSVIFLLAGLSLAFRALRNARTHPDAPKTMPNAAKLLVCWAAPWWIILEISPTKLPHYTLPVYPALALLCGAAAAILLREREFAVTRRIGAIMFALIGGLLSGGLTAALAYYGPVPDWQLAVSSILMVIICVTAALIWHAPHRPLLRRAGLVGVFASGIGVHLLAFGAVLPSIERLPTSKHVAALLTQNGYKLPLDKDQTVLSPMYSEPSLVYYLGTHIKIGGQADLSDLSALTEGAIVIVDSLHKKGPALKDHITQSAKAGSACFIVMGVIDGVNYSKGDDVLLHVLHKAPCTREIIEDDTPSLTQPK